MQSQAIPPSRFAWPISLPGAGLQRNRSKPGKGLRPGAAYHCNSGVSLQRLVWGSAKRSWKRRPGSVYSAEAWPGLSPQTRPRRTPFQSLLMEKLYDPTLKVLVETAPADWLPVLHLPQARVSVIDADIAAVLSGA